jgi:hypothetical protein
LKPIIDPPPSSPNDWNRPCLPRPCFWPPVLPPDLQCGGAAVFQRNAERGGGGKFQLRAGNGRHRDHSLVREWVTRAHHLLFTSCSAGALLEVSHRTSPVRNNLARPSSDHTPLGGLAVCASSPILTFASLLSGRYLRIRDYRIANVKSTPLAAMPARPRSD